MLKSNEPEKIEIALAELNQLILKSSNLELIDYQSELSNVLLVLQDNFELENFDNLLSNSLISLILKQPDCIQQLSTLLYKKETNIYSQIRLLRAYLAIVIMFVQNKSAESNIQNLSTHFGKSLLLPLNSTDIYNKIFQTSIFRPVGQMLIKNLCIFARISNDLALLNETCKFLTSFEQNCKVFREEIKVGLKWLIEGYQAKQAMTAELMELMEFGQLLFS